MTEHNVPSLDNKSIQPPQRENPLLGQTIIEGSVIIDHGQWVTELRKVIAAENPQTDSEKIQLASTLVKNTLKDALTPASDDPKTMSAVTVALERTSKMSEIVENGYGICSHFNTLSLFALEETGVKAILYGNPGYHHTFLYVNLDEEWFVEDPFAEVYFQNREGEPKLFPDECYLGPSLKMFAKTSTVDELPNTVI